MGERLGIQKSKNFVWIGGVLLVLLSSLIAYLFPGQGFNGADQMLTDPAGNEGGESSSEGDVKALTWKLLQKFDYKQNIVAEDLKPFLDQKIRLPGFAVPLSSDFNEISEFLFVPNQLACIHVPPPPPNLMLYIRLDPPAKIDDLSGPLWLEGVLKLNPTKSVYGTASWEIYADSVAPYEYEGN